MGMPDEPWAFQAGATARRSPRQQRADADRQLREYLQTLPMDERRQYVSNRQGILRGNAPQPAAPQQAAAPPQQQAAAPPQQQEPPWGAAAPELHIHIPQADNRSALQRMGDDIEDAYRDENDSRVAQAREQRRMAHEKDIEAMRLDALAQRLGGYQQADDPQRESPVSGVFKVWNPDMQRWEDGGNWLQFGS